MTWLDPDSFRDAVISVLEQNDKEYMKNFESDVKSFYINVDDRYILHNYREMVRLGDLKLKGTLMGVQDKDYKLENLLLN